MSKSVKGNIKIIENTYGNKASNEDSNTLSMIAEV